MTTKTKANWNLVVATLGYNAPKRAKFERDLTTLLLTPSEFVSMLWSLGDGYGRMSATDLAMHGLIRDWSHLRDSSDDAIAAVAQQIRIVTDAARAKRRSVKALGR